MTVVQSDGLVTLAFGDPETGVWGSVWSGTTAYLAILAPGLPAGENDLEPVLIPLSSVDAEDDWELRGEGVELSVEPTGDPGGSGAGSELTDAAPIFMQPCRVTGELSTDGSAIGVSAPGVRARRANPFGVDSLRQVFAWFGSGAAIGLDSSRAAKARGHDQDRVNAAVFGAEADHGSVAVVKDGRLSTTYRSDGRPSRMSLELWTPGEEPDTLFPRRVAGEAFGPGAAVVIDGLAVELHPLRAHHAGHDGEGAYLLARAR